MTSHIVEVLLLMPLQVLQKLQEGQALLQWADSTYLRFQEAAEQAMSRQHHKFLTVPGGKVHMRCLEHLFISPAWSFLQHVMDST